MSDATTETGLQTANDRFCDQYEIMKRLHISKTTFFELRRAGKFPKEVRSFGRRKLWLRVALEDFERREMINAR